MLPTLFLDRKKFLGQSSRITERLQGPGDTSLVQSDLSKFELWWFLPKEATSANRSVLLIGRNGEEPTRRFGQDAAPDPPSSVQPCHISQTESLFGKVSRSTIESFRFYAPIALPNHRP